MIRPILLVALVSGTAIAGWSTWIWSTCGYDCGVLGVTKGPASIVGWYLGLALLFVAGAGLVIQYVAQKRR